MAGAAATREWPPGPGPLRAFLIIGGLVATVWWLGHKVQDGQDAVITKAGRIEVTARLMERPPEFPARGSYMCTYVLKYQVIMIHQQDPQGKYKLKPAGWQDVTLPSLLGASNSKPQHHDFPQILTAANRPRKNS